MKPNDKPKKTKEVFEEPKLYVMIGDEKFPRLGLETAFVDYVVAGQAEGNKQGEKNTSVVGGEVCSCNLVRVASCGCVKHQSCSCVGHRSCSCVNNRSSGGRSSGTCRCVPVH